jgi:hypothetical protein
LTDSPSEDGVVSSEDATKPLTPDATSASSTETPDDQGDKSSDSPSEKPATMLDAVKAALKPKEDSPTSEPGKVEPDKAPTEKKEGDESDEFTEEDLKRLNQKTQRRIRDLVRDVKAKSEEADRFKGKADEYDKIETFVRNSGLSNEIVGATLQIAALMRQNPGEALRRLTPIVNQLRQVVGEELPPELAERVKQGFLTEQDARALARSNADAQLLRRQQNETDQRTQAERAAQERQSATEATVSTVEKWEAQKAANDPDWKLKQAEIAEQVELVIERETRKRGQPWFPTPDEAVKLSQEAYDQITERHKRFVPRPRAANPLQPGGASNRNVTPPKNMLDVVRQTVGAA